MKIIVTIPVFNEDKTIETTIDSIFDQNINAKVELVMVASGCTDNTVSIINSFIDRGYPINLIQQSERKGKVSAINKVLPLLKARRDCYCIFTDGDVILRSNAFSNLIIEFINKPNVKAVAGRPIPLNTPQSILGEIALENSYIWNQIRETLNKSYDVWALSGYLYAVKSECLPERIPDDCIIEDTFMGLMLINQGYDISYSESAVVYVKFPTNFRDYYLQKTRNRVGWRKVLISSPNQFKELRQLKKSIILHRICSGNGITIISWLLDKTMWTLSNLSRGNKDWEIWKPVLSTKSIKTQ